LQGSPSFQTCIQQDQKQSAENSPENYGAAFNVMAEAYRNCLGDFVHDRKDEILVVFTVILAFSTIFLWVATRDLVSGADKNAGKQLRPYVFLSSAKISDVLGTPKIGIKIKNFGQTPAYSASFWTEGHLREYPLKSKLERRRSDKSPSIDIGPTGALETSIDWNGPITEADKIALMAKTKAIYIFGKLEYRDTFGNSWFTEYRFMEGGEFPLRSDGGDLPHTRDGNKAT
jgi:hypothetical protein